MTVGASFHNDDSGGSGLVWFSLQPIGGEILRGNVPNPSEDTEPSVAEVDGYRVQVFVSDASGVRLSIEVAE